MSAVIGMGRCTPGDFTEEVSGDYRVGIGPADAARSFVRNAAWPHVADPAAEAFGPKPAGGLLAIQTGETSIYAIPFRFDQRLQRRLVPDTVLGFFNILSH